MSLITGWFNTDAVTFSDCPRCKQTAGFSCRTPKGRKTNVHTDRCTEYKKIVNMDYYMLTDIRRDVINNITN